MSRVSLKYKGEVGICCGNFCDKEQMIKELKAQGVVEFMNLVNANTMLGDSAKQILRIMERNAGTIARTTL